MMFFLRGMFRREAYLRWLESIAGNRAVDLGLKECQRCGHCCAMRPCIPTPKELDAIADYLKMDVRTCVSKFFVVDDLGGEVKFIFPAKETQLDILGRYVPSDRTFDEGYCIFHDKVGKACKIYPVRPQTAKEINCWVDTEGASERAIAEWTKVDIRNYVDDDALEEEDYDNDYYEED